MVSYEIIYLKIKNIYIQIKNGKVYVKAPKKVSKNEIDKIVENKLEWIEKCLKKEKYKQEKKELYTDVEFTKLVEKQVEELVKETGLYPNKIKIKNIKSAWGICSANKNITINYNLIKYEEKAIRYVILHELCHLKYMNHSREFWALVEKYMPEYKEIKKQFRE